MLRLTSPAYRDYWGGAILLLIGLGAAFRGRDYALGTLNNIGAGFFPAILGIILALCGIALIGTAVMRNGGAERTLRPRPEWRGWSCICLSVIVFAVLCTYTGLAPATFACVFIAGMGDHDNTLRDVLFLATAITVAGAVVFWWGLGIVIPLFSPNIM